MVDCSGFAELTDSYIDGSISVSDKADYQAHMSECSACKSDYEFTKKLFSTISSLPQLEVPEDFLDNINARIDREKAPAYRLLRNRRAYSAAAAGLALALMIGTSPWELIRKSDEDKQGFKDSVIAGVQSPEPVSDEAAAAQPEEPTPAAMPEPAPTVTEAIQTPVPSPAKAPAVQKKSRKSDYAAVQKPVSKPVAEATMVPNSNDIAIPSSAYVVSEESDAVNVAKIEKKGKLQESYALVESVDNMVYTPDVQRRLEEDGNIIISEAAYEVAYETENVTIEAIPGDTNALSSSVMVSRDDMNQVNRALDVFHFQQEGNCYYMTDTELNQFLNTLDNLGVPYQHNSVTDNEQVVVKLITT